MADEFDIIHLNEDETQEIINWAVSAGAISLLLNNVGYSLTEDASLDNVVEATRGYMEGVGAILESMPECIRQSCLTAAQQHFATVMQEEQEVAEFVEELKDL